MREGPGPIRREEILARIPSNLLRLTNSACFGYPRAVSTVRYTIVLLDGDEIFQIVVGSVVGRMARQSVRGYGPSPSDLWDHLMAAAVFSRKLGEALHPKIPGYTFTAGLPHDIGQVVLETFGITIRRKIPCRLLRQGRSTWRMLFVSTPGSGFVHVNPCAGLPGKSCRKLAWRRASLYRNSREGPMKGVWNS